MTDLQQLQTALAALEAQRPLLGDAVTDIAVAPLRARLQALHERSAETQQLKQVTVVFVDTVGSTAMAQRLDPEDIHAILDGVLQRLTAIIASHHGRVLQYTGDGLLAAFGADEAREDDPECAIRAGLAMLAEAGRSAQAIEVDHGAAGFAIRVGIDTGPALLGGGVEGEGNIRGSVVNMAARMEQAAPPGGLRIHHDTYRHVRGVFKVTEQPLLPVKGSDEPQATYLVHGTKPRAFRVVTRGIEGVETRMVAREAELEQLQEAFRSLHEKPRFHLVTIVAEAGIGKSRLLYEFENWVEAHPLDVCLFRGRAEPQTQSQPFGLLRNLLGWRLQITDEDDAVTARRKLIDGVAGLLPEDGQAEAHLLGQLIGLDFSDSPHVRGILDDAAQIRNRGFHAAAQALRQTALRHRAPPLILLDDIHWADDGSLDFLSYFAQVQREQAALMVCLTRQTLFERRADWALLTAAQTRIELQPLDKRGSRELAGVLLQRVDKVPVALRELVVGGAEGNPFYMEELVRMLVDEGAIVTTGERWEVQPDKLLAAHVPPTLTGVLQARLDSLPASEKRALQHAAVIGFVFWEQALTAQDAGFAATLPSLLQRGLLLRREHSAFSGQVEYGFKHQLLHQVVYDSVLKRHRRALHAQVAAWVRGLVDEPPAATLGLAADHHERAGEMGPACALYTRAAEDAAARGANDEMLSFVGRALPLAGEHDAATRWRLLAVRERHLLRRGDRRAHAADLEALARLAAVLGDDKRTEVALRRAAMLRNAGDFAGAEAVGRAALAQARPPATEAPGAIHTAALHHCLASSLLRQGRYAEARQVAGDGLALARARDERAEISRLLNVQGLIAMEQGDLMVAAEAFELGLKMAREIGNRAGEGLRLSNLGSVYPRLGDYARARQCLEQGLKLARALGERTDEAALLLNSASVAHLQGDDTGAMAYANAAVDSAAATGLGDVEAFARMVAGHAELGLGRFEAARSAYTEARDQLQLLKMRREQVLDPVSGLARVALAEGRIAEALAQVEPLLEHLAAGGQFDGTEEPLLLPLTCWRVLAAADDPRAGEVLANAMAELQSQAARISDPRARSGFLGNVPHHRELVAAWERRADAVRA